MSRKKKEEIDVRTLSDSQEAESIESNESVVSDGGSLENITLTVVDAKNVKATVDAVVSMFGGLTKEQQQEAFIILSDTVEFDDEVPEENEKVSDDVPPAAWLQIVLAKIGSGQIKMTTEEIRSAFRSYTVGMNAAERDNVRHQVRTTMALLRQAMVITETAIHE